MENKPHSRDKRVGSGSASVHKGDAYGGQVGSGAREGQRQESSGSRAGLNMNSSLRNGLILMFISKLFNSMNRKTRRIVLIIVGILLILSMLRSCMPADLSVSNLFGSTQPSYSSNNSTSSGEKTPTATNSNGSGSIVTPSPTPASTTARERFYQPKGNGQDEVTVMVYMCGTDLESKYGMGTSDLVEMTNATIADNVNLIVETGGCKKWQNSIISAGTNQIYRVSTNGVTPLENNLGNNSMVDPQNLVDFINYCKTNYPADRNILIMWDHGGGSISGYGYDEKHANDGTMDLAEFNSALKASGVKFDWIGFDACLMATLETAMVCDDYADYLIASEESEPGTGWHYTNWLTQLSKNTSVDTLSLSKTLVDDFVSVSTSQYSNVPVTLSVIDLAQLQASVPATFTAFSQSTNTLLSGQNYTMVSNARAGSRQFAQSQRINQVDVLDFADRIGTNEAKVFAQTLRDCVKYNKTNISRAYGVSIYFPYENMRTMKYALNTYDQLGMDAEYSKCITSFASLASSGQIAASPSYSSNYGSLDLGSILGGTYDNPLESLLGGYGSSSSGYSSGYAIDPSTIIGLLSALSGRSIPSEYDWLDTDLISRNAQFVSENYINPADIKPTLRSDGKTVVSLTDEQWELIQTLELSVYVDDGAGFIDLGRDNVFTLDGNDLLLTYDNTWLTINGQVVAYYLESDVQEEDGSWTTTGVVPALLSSTDENGEAFTQQVNLEVVFDKNTPNGTVVGARPVYTDETETIAKGNIPLKTGDELRFLCDYYRYDGTLDGSYELGTGFTVTDSGLVVENLVLDEITTSVSYRFTDIYNNHYWTPAFLSNSRNG